MQFDKGMANMDSLDWFGWLLILTQVAFLVFIGYAIGLTKGDFIISELRQGHYEKIKRHEELLLEYSESINRLETGLRDLKFVLEAGSYTSDDQLILVIDKALGEQGAFHRGEVI